jgi:ankyrin repeat protein
MPLDIDSVLKNVPQENKLFVETLLGNEVTSTWLHIACGNGDPELVGILLALGADPNHADGDNGWTPMFYCVMNYRRRNEKIDLLLKAGARNITDKGGRTARDLARKTGASGMETYLEQNMF